MDTEKNPLTRPPCASIDAAALSVEFLRIPDATRIFGVKKGVLYRWIREGHVRSVNVRESGAKTGVRLVHYESLRGFLLSFEEKPEPNA